MIGKGASGVAISSGKVLAVKNGLAGVATAAQRAVAVVACSGLTGGLGRVGVLGALCPWRMVAFFLDATLAFGKKTMKKTNEFFLE